MHTYTVKVIIENKPGINDPEGATILNDLILKGSHSEVSDVRTAKMLYITVRGKSSDDVKKRMVKMCDEMRIYNPMVSRAVVTVSKKP